MICEARKLPWIAPLYFLATTVSIGIGGCRPEAARSARHHERTAFSKGIQMDDEKRGTTQSGGVNITGGTVSVGGDIIGHDKIVGTEISKVQLDQILRPVEEAVRTAAPVNQPEAMQKLDELKTEAAKGKNAKDNVVAKLIDGLVSLPLTSRS
jgi:hypothetical protein